MHGTLPLFEHFPQLVGALPWQAIAELPTPVTALPGISERAWIKRDDLTHTVYGGNKIRKLEFIVAEALQQRKNHIITFGAIGTNHGVATALLCRQFGLRCTVLLFDQPVTKTVRDNLLRMHALGAKLVYCGSLARTVAAFYLHVKRLSPRAYFLFAGGSNVAGTFGYINAALELKHQIDQAQCPSPETIVVPVGSSATLAGLTIGARLAGLDSRIIGVRVAPSHVGVFPACTAGTVQTLMNRTCSRLQRNGITLPAMPKPTLTNDYFGEGYGVSTDAGAVASRKFTEAGVTLDDTYTAKAAAAFLDQLGSTNQPVLYWHTLNSRPVDKVTTATQLPTALQQLVHSN